MFPELTVGNAGVPPTVLLNLYQLLIIDGGWLVKTSWYIFDAELSLEGVDPNPIKSTPLTTNSFAIIEIWLYLPEVFCGIILTVLTLDCLCS